MQNESFRAQLADYILPGHAYPVATANGAR